MEYRGRAALVTGASSGIGEAFARALAARGMDLLLAARSEERLRAVAADLGSRHGVRVEVVPIDLAERDAPRRLQAVADERGFDPDLLVNNAGLGALGRFVDLPLERQLEMVRVNAEALVALSRLYVPRMMGRRRGAVVNVASAAGLQPLPFMAVYAASKAFVVSFSEALWAECRRHGVRVVVVCPGPVAGTRFGERARIDYRGSGVLRTLPRDVVVSEALRALDRDRPVVVPGLANGVLALAASLAPRRLQLAIADRVFQRLARSRDGP
jgi:short-subunit dehydrogenase